MSFAAINRQFTTPADFTAYLATLARPTWPIGSVYHHTYKPTEAQWAGLHSMQSMQAGYAAKGWTSGPHCYLALGSLNPKHDGIWVMTPPSQPGTHAGLCNKNRFGIEVVGNFETHAPSLPQQQQLLDTLTALHRWAAIGADLLGHRDCMPDRTCPGNAFYALRASLRLQLGNRLAYAGRYVVRHTQAIFEAPIPDGPIALQDTAELTEGQVVEIDEVKNGWCHLASAVGFVPIAVLTRL